MGFRCAPLHHWTVVVDSLHLPTGIGSRGCVIFLCIPVPGAVLRGRHLINIAGDAGQNERQKREKKT